MIQKPTSILTGRTSSLLSDDLEKARDALTENLKNAAVLVIGGAGSIGSETIALLSDFPLKSLIIVDQDENGLARLMRRLRGSPNQPRAAEIHTLPLSYGSPVFYAALASLPAFDFVLNFAALKHVRSEKDVWSTLQMMQTNILWQSDLLDALAAGKSNDARFFSVSTDKAANPVSFMGATKRLMEHVIFNTGLRCELGGGVTSARFANIAYSQGSLLESFVQRLEAQTPLAAPQGIKRFFMDLEEAGQLCLLAAVLGEAGSVYIPDLDPAEHLVDMQTAAERFLSANGYEAISFGLDDQADAFSHFAALQAEHKWPLILTPADTAGEKPYEEFVGIGETALASDFEHLQRINFASDISAKELRSFLNGIQVRSADKIEALTSKDLMDWVAKIEPAFRQAHIASSTTLDDRI